MIELCPCCGSRANTGYIVGSYESWHWVYCTNKECGLQTKQFGTKKEAIVAWNRRVK